MSSSKSPPRVLLSNDDGPPNHESPYIFALYMDLTRRLGWDVKVVIPSSQKSWIGKAYHIKEVIKGAYYYPKEPGGQGVISEVSRPLEEGEVAEWILLDGTPATCVNIAIHNLYAGHIDLVISGPNYGRNTSSAFSLSSGTIGAALSGCLSGARSIALSYGTVNGTKPTAYTKQATELSGDIMKRLWDDWGKDAEGLHDENVDLYNVNLPMIPQLAEEGGLEVVWTRIWRNTYGQLFKTEEEDRQPVPMRGAGPDAPPMTPQMTKNDEALESDDVPASSRRLAFHFAPKNMGTLVNPPLDTVDQGTDTWAVLHGKASVTPLRAAFMECPPDSLRLGSEQVDKESLVHGRLFKL